MEWMILFKKEEVDNRQIKWYVLQILVCNRSLSVAPNRYNYKTDLCVQDVPVTENSDIICMVLLSLWIFSDKALHKNEGMNTIPHLQN